MNTPIDIKLEKIGKILLFRFYGELDSTNADKTFTALYNTIGDFDQKSIIFNFADLKYLDNRSAGYLVDIFENVIDGGAELYHDEDSLHRKWRMCLSEVKNEEVKEFLDKIGVLAFIPTYDTDAKAIEAMSKSI